LVPGNAVVSVVRPALQPGTVARGRITDGCATSRDQYRAANIYPMPRLDKGAITLRLLTPDDWRLWRELRLEALREAPYAFGSKLADWEGEGDTEARWRARLSAVALNMVATLDAKGVGMVSATIPDGAHTSELLSMWVEPAARRQGVADALVTGALQWISMQGAHWVKLAVFRDNRPAVDFYRRQGFVSSNEDDDSGPDTAEVWMMRSLVQP
jgi:ribosomal protein S18 acetylase RimI-like enzyme